MSAVHAFARLGRSAASTVLLLWVVLPLDAWAQGTAPRAVDTEGVLPEAVFHVAFRKYAPPARAFSPFYSWDGSLGLDATAFRHGVHAMDIAVIVQTVGTENLGRQIGVGATGYVLGFGYVNASRPITFSVGFRHLSSHLTRDLDEKEEEVRSRGGDVPAVRDAPDSNIIYVKAAATLSRWPFSPQIVVLVAPINFRFGGGEPGHVRPVYAGSRWQLWQGRDAALTVETQHELGTSVFDSYSLQLELARRNESAGRFQAFISVSPGHALHVSPNIGGVVDGVAVGVRVRFQS